MDGYPTRERKLDMITPARTGARLVAAALALMLLPVAAGAAEDPSPPVHPWKLAYARRIAREGMERRERKAGREDHERWIEQSFREWREVQRARKRAIGDRARPALPEGAPGANAEPATPARRALGFGATTFTTPANTIVNSRLGDGAGSGQSETSIAAFGDIMVAAWNDGEGFVTGGDTQGWATSTDGGVTWIDRGSFPHPGGVTNFEWLSDPVLAVNEKTGAFYFSALCDFSNALGPRAGVAVVKGRWNGLTIAWGNPVVAHETVFAPSEIPDKNWIVADSVSNRVYLTYTQFQSGLSRIVFQRSDSSAAVWSAPQQLSPNTAVENGFVQGSRPIVDGNGRLYVVYELIGQSFSDFYKVCSSSNQGLTFTVPTVAESLYTNFGTGTPGFNRPQGIDFCGVAVDRSQGPNRGRLYLSWAECINWLDEVFTLGLAGNKSEVESNDTPAAATPVTVGQTIRGSIGSATDIDLYSITLVQGQHIVVGADSASTSAQDAFTLRLLAGDGITRLTFTTFDNGVNPVVGNPNGFPSGWLFTAPATGTYYVRVAAVGAPGAYRLRTGFVHRDLERGRDQRDVFVGYSDNGTAWSDPKLLSDDPVGYDSFVPEVAVAPDGGLYCSWYDYRDAPAAKDGGAASVYLARSGDGGTTWTTLGALADSLSDWTAANTNIQPNQGDYMSLLASGSYVWSIWSDARRGDPDAFLARIPLIPNGAQVAFANVRLAERSVSIDWRTTPSDTLTMRLYRSQNGGAFQFLSVVQFDAAGTLTVTDTTVAGDNAYSYRLGRFTNGVELFYGQVSVFLPGSFALRMGRPRPNPIVDGSFVADFTLATDQPADLILFDITGREVFRRAVNLGKGQHALSVPVGGGLKQGLYVLTLRQGGHNASTRAYIVR